MYFQNLILKLNKDNIFYSEEDELLKTFDNLEIVKKSKSSVVEILENSEIINVHKYFTVKDTMNKNGNYYIRIENPEQSYIDCQIIYKDESLKHINFSNFIQKSIFVINYKKTHDNEWLINAMI